MQRYLKAIGAARGGQTSVLCDTNKVPLYYHPRCALAKVAWHLLSRAQRPLLAGGATGRAEESRQPSMLLPLLRDVDKWGGPAGDLRQHAIPLLESAKLENLRVGSQRVGFDRYRFGLPARLRDFLFRFEFDLFQLVLRRQRLLFGGHLGFNGFCLL